MDFVYVSHQEILIESPTVTLIYGEHDFDFDKVRSSLSTQSSKFVNMSDLSCSPHVGWAGTPRMCMKSDTMTRRLNHQSSRGCASGRSGWSNKAIDFCVLSRPN